jgi:hypothetical protein
VYTVVDNINYEQSDSVTAVDSTFKLLMSLNAEYPACCKDVWLMLQVGFYEIKTLYDPNRLNQSVKSILVSLSGTLIIPDEVVIGNRTVVIGNRTDFNESKGLSSKNCTLILVPLKLVLEQFFSLPKVLKDTVDNVNMLNAHPTPIRNIIQGKVWKKMA